MYENDELLKPWEAEIPSTGECSTKDKLHAETRTHTQRQHHQQQQHKKLAMTLFINCKFHYQC